MARSRFLHSAPPLGSLERQAFLFPPLLVAIALALTNVAADLLLGGFSILLLLVSLVLIGCSVFFSTIEAQRLVRPLVDIVPHTGGITGGTLTLSNHGEKDIPVEIKSLALAIEQIAAKQAQDLAAMQKLERVRSEFLGNVSHELRTPIFAVQGFIETLLDGAIDDPEVNRDFLERARLQAARLNSLLSDLIDISRIESGEMRMSFRLFDIRSFLREITNEMQGPAAMHGIKLKFISSIITEEELTVFGDKERLKQVMVNLIDNAIKYTNEGGSVTVELLPVEGSDEEVTIAVIDTGIGIDEEHLPRLFERFYRVDKDRARSSPGGTGLGLAIVKHIIEAHRNQIRVVSSPGVGSTFSFSLHKEPFR